MPQHVQFQRLLEVQKKNPSFNDSSVSDGYFKALNHLWNARYSACADAASSVIENDPDHPMVSKFYRVWIEALARLEDADSLSFLGEHLLELGQEKPELKQTFLALRGIIHAELDQAPALRMVLRACSSRQDNPYCLELLEIGARRGLCDSDFAIVKSNTVIDDYLIWNTLVQDLSQTDDRSSLNDCLRHVQNCFPGSPTTDEVNMHLAFEHHQWQAAQACASKLAASFKDHPDYQFFAAFAAYEAKDYTSAKSFIENVTGDRFENDPDTLSLRGNILAHSAIENDNEEQASSGRNLLEKAVKIYRRFGHAADHCLVTLKAIDTAFGGRMTEDTVNVFREPHQWLVMLSPRRADEMATAQDHQVERLVRPMGCEVAPGDVVLFVSRAAHTAKKPASARTEWRLLAMYRASSKPMWHPVTKWQTVLELIDRPEHPVPFDAHELKSDISLRGKRSTLPKGHHARFGVYKLDENAMDLVIAAVKRRSDGIDHEAERRNVESGKKSNSV